MSHDLSYNGSPRYVMNYTVLGEDGTLYFRNYKHPTLGNSFFMTQEDYIQYLERKISSNQEKILKINEENLKFKNKKQIMIKSNWLKRKMLKCKV